MKVCLASFLRGNNYGDVLIYETVKNRLEASRIETIHYEVSTPINLSLINSADFLLFPGGGLIEQSAPDIIRFFDFYRDKINIPYGIIGLGAGGQFDYSTFAVSLQEFVNNSEFFYVRDYETKQILEFYGAKKDKIKKTCDVVWACPGPKKKEKKYNGVFFREMPYSKQGYTKEILETIPRTGLDSIVVVPDNFQNIVMYLPECKIVIAMRYHVVLSALKYGAFPIAINYCPKVRRLMKQVFLEEYCIEPWEYWKLERKIRDMRIIQPCDHEDVIVVLEEEAKDMLNTITERILSYEKH
jgi:polysaccharide pyruvyl transferase WcaK-like protein